MSQSLFFTAAASRRQTECSSTGSSVSVTPWPSAGCIATTGWPFGSCPVWMRARSSGSAPSGVARVLSSYGNAKFAFDTACSCSMLSSALRASGLGCVRMRGLASSASLTSSGQSSFTNLRVSHMRTSTFSLAAISISRRSCSAAKSILTWCRRMGDGNPGSPNCRMLWC